MKKALVTGGTGFVGTHLSTKLVKEGYDVKVLSRPLSNTYLLKDIGVEIIPGDITDVATVEQAVKGCQQVYHLAAKMPQQGTSKKLYNTINVEGTKNVARACLKANVEKLVYASSAGVYGVIKHAPVNENTQLNPSSAYRESKFLSEQVVFSYHKKEGLPVVVVRLPGVFGAGSCTWLGLVRAISKKNFRIIGTGENHDHVVHVSDIADALQLCAEIKGIEGKCYLIGANEAIKVKHLIDIIGQELGLESFYSNLPIAPYRAFNYLGETVYKNFGFELPGVYRYSLFLANKILDISKAKKELGYSPKVSIREGIKETIEWYRSKKYI